jgi:hypothetical protein
MRRRIAAGDGYTLVEMVLVSALFLVVLTATLGAGGTFAKLTRDSDSSSDQIDRARQGMERGMRQLRNLARRVDVPTIARATSGDFIFQTSDPERTWVRYCLQTRSTGRVWLWSLNTAGSVTSAMSGACPGTGWDRADVLAQNVTNSAANRDYPLFDYGCVQTAPASCPSTTADLDRITNITMQLLIDDDLTVAPPEARLVSAVYLRNQNEPPTAAFAARPLATRQVLLNASGSTDPEGRTLRFMWFKAPAPSFTCDDGPPASLLISQGATLTYAFSPSEGLSGTSASFELVVCDPGDLQARATAQVTIP